MPGEIMALSNTRPQGGMSARSAPAMISPALRSLHLRKSQMARRHGMSQSPTYYSWKAMKQRCLNPADPAYDRYGGRGIKLCSRWMSFEAFLSDMGTRPEGYCIDRIDNDGDYTPENCRWATDHQQQRNRRSNMLITHDGRTMCIEAWAAEVGMRADTLAYRIRNGWNFGVALTLPRSHANRPEKG